MRDLVADRKAETGSVKYSNHDMSEQCTDYANLVALVACMRAWG